MKRIRPFHLAACLLMGAGAILSSCTSDEPTPLPKPNLPGRQGVVIINQGNAYTSLPGSLDYVSFQHDTKQQGVFAQANGGNSLGMSPQNGIAYGSNIYLAVYGDNLVRVIDRTTFRQKATISISQPEAVYAGAGSVYVADNTGYVTRFDTLSWSKQASVAVGPNPAALAGANGLLYVSISDGYNSSGGYANGFRVVRLDPRTLQKRDEIKVGMNPGELCADANGTVYVVCRGDYGATPSRIWWIRSDGAARDYCDGTHIATHGYDLVVVNSVTDWTTYQTKINSALYHNRMMISAQPARKDYFSAYPGSVTRVQINPASGEIFMCGDTSATGYAQKGYVFRYDWTGRIKEQINTGIHPFGLIFI